jgi:hypothetical protein
MRRALVPAFALVIWIMPTASSGQAPSPTPFDPDWHLVADSAWIVRARLEVPRDKLEQAIQNGQGDHVLLKFDPAEIIKRPPGDPDVEIGGCTYWTGPQEYMASPKEILAFDDREILIFVDEVFVYQNKDRRAHFLSQDKRAILPYDAKKAESLKQEVRNQRLIAENFAKLPAAKPDEFEGPVKELISKMLVKETQQEAVYALQKLDPRAAPSIIRLMDDDRTLPRKRTLFINPPGFFETYRHYSPGVVVDVLATVLPGLVRQSPFGQIYNGSTDQERKQVVDAWRVYLHYRISEEANPQPKAKPPAPAK